MTFITKINDKNYALNIAPTIEAGLKIQMAAPEKTALLINNTTINRHLNNLDTDPEEVGISP